MTAAIAHRKLLVLADALTALSLPASAPAADSDVIAHAQGAYYGAKARGLKQFRCELAPDWNVTLKDVANPDEKKGALAILNKVHMSIVAGPDIDTAVGHTDLPGENEQQSQAFKQIYDGMQQAMGGFMKIYSVFMFNPPLPDPAGTYDLKPDGSGWTLTYKEDNTDIHTGLDQNAAVHDMRISSPAFTSTLQPALTASPAGFLLASYHATYDSATAADKTVLQVGIDHQLVDGIELPKMIALSGSTGGAPFEMDVAFTDCTVTKR